MRVVLAAFPAIWLFSVYAMASTSETTAEFDLEAVANSLYGDGRHKQISVPFWNGAFYVSLESSLGIYWNCFRDVS